MPPILSFDKEHIERFCKKDLEKPAEESAVHEFPQSPEVLQGAMPRTHNEGRPTSKQSQYFLAELIHCWLFLNGKTEEILGVESVFDGEIGRWRYPNNSEHFQFREPWGFVLKVGTGLASHKHIYQYYLRFLSINKHRAFDELLAKASKFSGEKKKVDAFKQKVEEIHFPPGSLSKTPDGVKNLDALIDSLRDLDHLNRRRNRVSDDQESIAFALRQIDELEEQIKPLLEKRGKAISTINKTINGIFAEDPNHEFGAILEQAPWVYDDPFAQKRMQQHRSNRHLYGG